jgi:hypothetical protein
MELNPALFVLPQEEERHGISNLTYGSLTTRGLHTMVKTVKHYFPNPDVIEGMDLGCGDGELLYHLQELLPGSRWEGVEIAASRVEKQRRPVTIWEGNMLDENYRNYNLLHADNLCLDDDVAEALEAKILREFRGVYISYRTPSLFFLHKAVYLGSEPTETTWTTHKIHYYSLH